MNNRLRLGPPKHRFAQVSGMWILPIMSPPYVLQVLEETLRLWPTAPAFTRRPYEDTVIGGKYRLEKDPADQSLPADADSPAGHDCRAVFVGCNLGLPGHARQREQDRHHDHDRSRCK